VAQQATRASAIRNTLSMRVADDEKGCDAVWFAYACQIMERYEALERENLLLAERVKQLSTAHARPRPAQAVRTLPTRSTGTPDEVRDAEV
jgi:hypothetical protein